MHKFVADVDIVPRNQLDGAIFGEGEFTIDVIAPLTASPLSGIEGEIGRPVAGSVVASGGKGPYTWSATGLPAGTRLAATTTAQPVVALIGTPTATASDFAFVRLSDAHGSLPIDIPVPVYVVPPVSLTAPEFPGRFGWQALRA